MLNLFFENINGTLEILLIGIFLFAVYWFVLRRYNSLGFRMLVLCFFLFVACSIWLYRDELNLKNMLTKGEQYIATVNSKWVSSDHKDNNVELSFTTRSGQEVNVTTDDYISKEEWQKFEVGKPLSVIYIPPTKQTFVQQSIMRFKEDKIYLYFFAGFWLVLGVILYLCLKKYKVKVDDRGNEWLETEDGKVYLDERKSGAYRTAKRGNILSKMAQAFGK